MDSHLRREAVTITQINYFLAAVAAGSLSGAANDLKVAQPTVSEQVRKLESSLGVVLFSRARHGLTLTEAGQQFLAHARQVAQDFEAAIDSVAGIRELEQGTVEFGMFNSGQYVLAGLVPEFRERFPQIRVRIIGANSAHVADAVRSGVLEAGIVALPIDARGLTIGDALWSCEAVYWHVDRAATAGPATIERINERPLVLSESSWSQADPTRRQLAERAQKLGRALVPDIEVETGAAALAIAATGVAGTIASLPVAQALGYDTRVSSASFDPPLIETFAVITRDPATLSPASRAMVELAEEHMRRLHNEYQPERSR